MQYVPLIDYLNYTSTLSFTFLRAFVSVNVKYEALNTITIGEEKKEREMDSNAQRERLYIDSAKAGSLHAEK